MPSWLSDWVGTDMAPLAYYALVAVILLVLIVLVLGIAKKVMGGGNGLRIKSRGPRLAVMDVASIDPKRKLVLIRRDEIEHLLLIGGQNDLVVEASILRVPATSRLPRNEPPMRADHEVEEDAERAARAAAIDPRVRRPAPVAAQPPMPAPPLAARGAEPRGASPLSRPVPPSAPPRAARPEPVPAAPAPVVEVPRVEAPPAQAPAPAEPRKTVQDAPPVEVPKPEAPGPAPAMAERVAPIATPAVAPPVASPAEAAPVRIAPPVQPPVAPAPTPIVRTRIAATGGEASPTVSAPVRSIVSPDDTPRGRAAGAPVSRVPIGGGVEPVRRPLPTAAGAPPVQPIQPRSMATPTVPIHTSPVAAATPPAGDGTTIDPPTPADAPADTVLARLLKSGGAEAGGRQGEQGARVEPTLERPSDEPRATAAPEGPVATLSPDTLAPVVAPAPPMIETGERRPLSVRSFASAIQTRQSAAENPQAAPVTAVGASPQKIEPEPVAAPSARLVAPVRASAQPMAPAPDASEDKALEDFLSDHLNSELNGDIWNAPDAAGPKPADETGRPRADADQRIAMDRDFEAKAAPPVEAVRAEAPAKPRPLTLEEEMERLLGDFDLETTDRRIR